ncbi:MAG: sugar kinase [Treponema sp.]|jgi:2-dehydro-3-deoxygluconokinase|nr:sugar kinase [Treponema sp.]
MNDTVITFGELLIRMDSPNHRRFLQTYPGAIETSFAGSEANVAASVSFLGGRSRFVSALPRSPLTDAAIAFLESRKIDVGHIVQTGEGRLGIYFVETGANQRPSNVIYDRGWSSISLTEPDGYNWDEAFKDGSWFHVSGVTPALSDRAAESTLRGVEKAKAAGLKVSCDINFRKKLWDWKAGIGPLELARQVMPGIIRRIDVLFGNEEDAELVLGIKAGKSDVQAGYIDVKAYEDLCRRIAEAYTNLSHIAFTLRESVSATYNRWGGILFDVKTGRASFSPRSRGEYKPYEITSIVDRVGAGDSFAGALIYALNGSEFDTPEKALDFSAAASCLAHSVRGDFNCATKNEILNLVKDGGSGRVVR